MVDLVRFRLRVSPLLLAHTGALRFVRALPSSSSLPLRASMQPWVKRRRERRE
ncbi:hypothetical protein Syun_003595 [Stephania yunnanensis]|uniref:Uncharacterized protein n=1 Tax=Stephania yunnanensis TaxID=152371 RepID=A0AAP0L2Y1_9MAGN